MAYSELIKNYEKIRDYMRDFYVYGFRTRNEFDKKSARSYDNEKRRVESWLSEYMSFHQDENGKNVFISVDSRDVAYNPLYKAFKAKSFTDKDIILHFYILDILADGSKLSVKDIAEIVSDEYLSFFHTDILPDESTVRNKLKEYAAIGLLKAEKVGKELLYSRTDSVIREDTLLDSIAFASEANPAGVVGSILLDKYDSVPEYFSFKHHYLLSALDQQILVQLLVCRKNLSKAKITFKTKNKDEEREIELFPLKIYVSSQNGKQYLMAYSYSSGRPVMHRLDKLLKVEELQYEENWELYDSYGPKFAKHLWGISEGLKSNRHLDHVDLYIHIGKDEEFIVRRLEREKRNGTVTRIDDNTVLFSADVYNAQEMIPWIRTFIGRIDRFESNNKNVVIDFYKDLNEMKAMYGGEDNDL